MARACYLGIKRCAGAGRRLRLWSCFMSRQGFKCLHAIDVQEMEIAHVNALKPSFFSRLVAANCLF